MTDIPGDTSTTTSLAPGSSLTSDIDFLGDVDFISTTLSEALSYGIIVSTTSTTMDLQLQLLDSTGAGITTGFGSNGSDAVINFTATATDDFFIGVQDRFNANIGDYTLFIDNSDTIMSTIATTETLAGGATLNSNVDVLGDVDVVRVSLTEGLSYGFVSSTSNPDMDLQLSLLDSAGAAITFGFGSNGSDAAVNFTATATDDFFVGVQDRFNVNTGDYALVFNDSDTILNSIATTETLAGGATLNSNVDVLGDVDVVRVSLTEGLSYGFVSSTSNPDMDLQLSLLDSAGAAITFGFGSNGSDAAINFTATATDDFFVGVQDRFNVNTGDYALVFNDSDTILNSIATTATVDMWSCVDSTIDVLGDLDTFGVDLVAGVSYQFVTSTTDPDMDLQLSLLDNAGAAITFGFGSNGSDAVINFTAGTTGTFYLAVSDRFNGNTGDFTLSATAGTDDNLTGSNDDDKILGGAGNDILVGLLGDDLLDGGDGDDILRGNVGNDTLVGGDGNDRMLAFSGNDTLSGGDGDDILNGGDGDDILDAGEGADTIFGSQGNDTANGGAGDDLLEGGAGNDTLNGDDGNDTLRGNDGMDVINGGAGNDTVFAGNDDDTVLGGLGNDNLNGSGGNDVIDGEDGDDVMAGENGDDTLLGGDGMDALRGGNGSDFMNGENDNDTMFGNAGEDTMFGGSGDDTMNGDQQNDALFGETGNDILRGGDGFDFLDGGSGDDTLVGGNGEDILVGGTGVDSLRGDANNDIFDFNSTGDSFVGAEDVIQDMSGVGAAGGDRIDVSTIDADTATFGDQSFTFLGNVSTAAGLSFGAGGLWIQDFGTQSRVFASLDGAAVDLAIKINDGALVTAADYIAGDFIL